MLKKFFIVFTLFLIGACYYDNEEELYPNGSACNLDNVTYSETILPLIDNNCYACHDASSNFGNVTLEGYASLIEYVNDGSLIGTIKHESGYSPMPQNAAKMLDCDIQKIEKWIQDGAPNN